MRFLNSILLLFFVVFTCGFSQPPSSPIRYSISADKDHYLNVVCQFQGDESGVTRLELPEKWANQNDLYKFIECLKCIDHDVKNTDKPAFKIISHSPGEAITICYRVKLQTQNINHDNYFRAIGGDDYFFATGHSLFVIPEHLHSDFHAAIDWTAMPKKWVIANSFGAEGIRQEICASVDEFRSAAFLGGNFTLVKCGKSKSPIYIAMRGEWPFSEKKFSKLVENIVRSQRDFWNDHKFPYYFISVIPIEGKNSMGGTGLTNTFSLFMSSQTDMLEDEYLNKLSWLLSHEHFHTWNGNSGRLCSSEPEGTMYWFSEGFTEYYAYKLNQRSCIISDQEYLNEANNLLREYFGSPVRDATNEQLAADFWNDSNFYRLPYARGFTLALYLDWKMQSLGKGISLDNFMQDLLSKAKLKAGKFSLDEWFDVLKSYLPEQDIQQIKLCILEGAIIPIESCLPSETYSLEWAKPTGFDKEKSMSLKEIAGVQPGSAAYLAGLRDGMKILEWADRGSAFKCKVVTKSGDEQDIVIKNYTSRPVPQLAWVKEKIR